ncbi:MAG: SDR family NAD(P)-dependent oxidoreductase [Verrucomicrobia bacterium]|nr:SDR family NAD(P)-dependent oxidoreductase [Verrucomicrobiota bacterium]
MKKTLLVTGAAGFIGSHLAEHLLRRGDRVVGLDNLNTAYDPARKRANLAEVQSAAQNRGQWEFVQGDIRDPALLDRLFDENGFDAVAHLAAMTGVGVSIEDPQLFFEVNLLGTLHLLNAAKQHLVGNFVLASTSSVYGNGSAIPFSETAACDRPLAPYPASKRAAEMLGFSYHHLYGLHCTVARFFSVYGPRNRPDSLACQVADGISRQQKVRLYRKGQMHRDWIYIDDLVRGIAAAVDRPLGYEIINLGRGEPVLVADFVALLEKHSGAKARLIQALLPDMDIPCAFADIQKARCLLDFQPAVSVAEGVERFWHWYKNQ